VTCADEKIELVLCKATVGVVLFADVVDYKDLHAVFEIFEKMVEIKILLRVSNPFIDIGRQSEAPDVEIDQFGKLNKIDRALLLKEGQESGTRYVVGGPSSEPVAFMILIEKGRGEHCLSDAGNALE